ncbi:MAG: hypothetical protein LBM77_10795, partial [Spirochaetaceae bacterium]|nr:hypothetical protein [Spirochaetaceae bacterium]
MKHNIMKRYSLVLLMSLLLLTFVTSCQTTSAIATAAEPFNSIRNNKAELQYFFSHMPKGGDLHNHLTGSIYAETYFQFAVSKNMYLDTDTYLLYP